MYLQELLEFGQIAGLILALVPIVMGCTLFVLIVRMIIRNQQNETNKRTEVALAAIEKNPDIDVEELLKKMAPKQKSLKEKQVVLINMFATWCGPCKMEFPEMIRSYEERKDYVDVFAFSHDHENGEEWFLEWVDVLEKTVPLTQFVELFMPDKLVNEVHKVFIRTMYQNYLIRVDFMAQFRENLANMLAFLNKIKQIIEEYKQG